MIEPRYEILDSLVVNKVFRIPKFQRFYSWQHKQRDDFFKDLFRLYEKGKDCHHFMATIVCQQTNIKRDIGTKEYHLYDIVDGQQRITTIILLLKAIQLRLSDVLEGKDLARVLVKDDGNLILLQTNNANEQLFNAYLRKGQRPDESAIRTHADRNLFEAINDCEVFLNEWENSGLDLVDLLRMINSRVGFVVYNTIDSMDVYTIFEVLNSRGLEVDWLDKCKSVLMGKAHELAKTEVRSEASINELYKIWGEIYNSIAIYPIPGHEIIRVCATIYLGKEESRPVSADEAIERFREYCLTPEHTIDVSKWINNVTEKLVELQQNPYQAAVTYILQARLLAVALMLSDSLTDGERNILLDQWERVTFRIFGLSGKDSRSKVGEYVRLASKVLSKKNSAPSFPEIMKELRHIGRDDSIGDAINIGLKNKNVYEDSGSTMCRYILWRYEEYLAEVTNSKINKELKNKIWNERSADESIEHIFPQNPEDSGPWEGKLMDGELIQDHVHRIGNLILLPISLNSAAKRSAFLEKINIYKQSEGLRMVQEIMKRRDWRQQEIDNRERKILRWAKEAWNDLE